MTPNRMKTRMTSEGREKRCPGGQDVSCRQLFWINFCHFPLPIWLKITFSISSRGIYSTLEQSILQTDCQSRAGHQTNFRRSHRRHRFGKDLCRIPSCERKVRETYEFGCLEFAAFQLHKHLVLQISKVIISEWSVFSKGRLCVTCSSSMCFVVIYSFWMHRLYFSRAVVFILLYSYIFLCLVYMCAEPICPKVDAQLFHFSKKERPSHLKSLFSKKCTKFWFSTKILLSSEKRWGRDFVLSIWTAK